MGPFDPLGCLFWFLCAMVPLGALLRVSGFIDPVPRGFGVAPLGYAAMPSLNMTNVNEGFLIKRGFALSGGGRFVGVAWPVIRRNARVEVCFDCVVRLNVATGDRSRMEQAAAIWEAVDVVSDDGATTSAVGLVRHTPISTDLDGMLVLALRLGRPNSTNKAVVRLDMDVGSVA